MVSMHQAEPIFQSNAGSSLSCGLDSSREMGLLLDADVNSLSLLESREGKGQRKAIFAWEQIIFSGSTASIHPEHEQQREKLVH